MSRWLFSALLICANALALPAFADPLLASAVLPTSRATQIGNTVTAFATIINAGTSAGEACGIALNSELPIDFSYQTTNNADNSSFGPADTPVNLAVGQAQSFAISFTMTGTFDTTDVALEFSCSNGGTASVISSLNTILLTSSALAIPDVVALVATVDNTGYSEINGADGTGVFSVATSNVGDSGDLVVTADAGDNGPAVNVLLCDCLLYTSPSPRDLSTSRMPSSA